ncbi:MAG: GNAT family N-acetyltransferase [Spirochaetia bacterium]
MENLNAIHIESDKLLLQCIEKGDKEFLTALWTDPEVTEYMHGPRNPAKLDKGLDESIENPFAEEYDLWVLTDKNSGTLLGHCGLLQKEIEGKQEIEVVYVIAKPFWRRGIAAEAVNMLIDYAFRVKGLKRVVALIQPANKGSEGVARKCGMIREREVIRPGGIRMLLFSCARDNRRQDTEC